MTAGKTLSDMADECAKAWGELAVAAIALASATSGAAEPESDGQLTFDAVNLAAAEHRLAQAALAYADKARLVSAARVMSAAPDKRRRRRA